MGARYSFRDTATGVPDTGGAAPEPLAESGESGT